VGRWALGAFGIGAPNRRNDRLGACTSVERCGTEKSDNDPHDEIAHLEAHIEELADKIESCRKFCSGTCSERATRVGRWKRARALAVCIPVSESRDQSGRIIYPATKPLARLDPAVVANNGRIVKLIGDGTIVEFGSVVDAVNCALSAQRSTADQSTSLPTIVLRIGINLGDVIIEGDDIYGDGVNIAARLEPLAEPGGICISSIVHESIGNRMDVRFQDGGEISVKNIDRPIRIWSWHPGTTPATAQRSIAANPTNVAGRRCLAASAMIVFLAA
jgi:adenylate cyclase